MGANSSRSTRRLTIENNDPTSVIKVSDDVVERLKGNQGVRRPGSNVAPASPTGVAPAVPAPTFLYEPSLTSLQIRQANLLELKKNDAYWEKRVRDLELNHRKMHDVMELEYNRALQETDGGQKRDRASQYVAPCSENKKAIVDCYRKYPNEPLRCAKEVQEFTRCIDCKRTSLIENRG